MLPLCGGISSPWASSPSILYIPVHAEDATVLSGSQSSSVYDPCFSEALFPPMSTTDTSPAAFSTWAQKHDHLSDAVWVCLPALMFSMHI